MNMHTFATAALALAVTAALPALAQPQDMGSMPGMTMPMPAPAKKPVAKKPTPPKAPVKTAAKAPAKPATKAQVKKPAAAASPHAGMDMSGMAGMDMSGMDMSGMAGMKSAPKPKAKPASKKPKASAAPHPSSAMHDMASMPGMGMSGMDHETTKPAATGAAPAHDMSSMPGMDMSSMPPEGSSTAAPAAGHDMPSMPGMDMSNMQGMNHKGMDVSSMPGMAASKDLPADAAPRTPLAAVTDADRAAAFPAVGPAHATHDQRAHSYWLLDRLEARDAGGGAWDATAWMGGDVNRVWLRSEGEVAKGRVEHGSFEALYGHAISPWWDVVGGVRVDAGEGPERAYAAFGVQGLSPYKFEVQATGYVGTDGRTAARLEGEYDTLLTNRLILQWRSEAELYGRSDPARRFGTGLSTLEAGVRLRYEFTRRFAPYIGVEVDHAFGETADFRRTDGASVNDTRLVAGLRIWL